MSGLDVEAEHRFRLLPSRTQAPRYWEGRYFLFVVLAFAVVGTAYWLSGLWLFYKARGGLVDRWFWFLLAICPALYLGLYGWITRYREHGYLKSRILGVDIDGVLNEHRTQFCQMLADRTGKVLDPSA